MGPADKTTSDLGEKKSWKSEFRTSQLWVSYPVMAAGCLYKVWLKQMYS